MFANINPVEKNIPVIYCLRGIAASMVCFYHFIVTTPGFIDNNLITDIFDPGKTGVYMFFVISGVVIPLSMVRGQYRLGNWGNFMFRRLARLEPPYLAAIILAICYFQVKMLVEPDTAGQMPDTRDLLLHVGYLVPFADSQWALPTFWTLGVEFQYYLAISILLPLVLQGNKISRYCFYGLFLVSPFLVTGYEYFLSYAVLFLMGILYAFLSANIIGSREYSVVMLLCIVVSTIVFPVSYTSIALLTILIIYFLPNFSNKPLAFLGKISYSLYLVHPITGAAFINFLSHRFSANYQKPILILAGYLLAIICAYIFYWAIEKPSQKLSSQIKYHRLQPAVKPAHNKQQLKAIKDGL